MIIYIYIYTYTGIKTKYGHGNLPQLRRPNCSVSPLKSSQSCVVALSKWLVSWEPLTSGWLVYRRIYIYVYTNKYMYIYICNIPKILKDI